MKHMKEKLHVPIVVWGPIGCGKSMGCRVLLEHCGFRVLALDGADEEDNRALIKKIRQVRGMKTNTEGENTIVLLDDFEGFTEQTRKEIASYLKKTEHESRLGGIIITLNQIRDPSMRDVAHLDNTRLFSPFEDILRDWFSHHHPWTAIFPDGRTEQKKGFGEQRVSLIKDTIATRDMRRIEIELKWVRTHRTTLQGGEKTFDNIFSATRQLFSKNGDWMWWSRHAEERDLLLLKEHFPTYQLKPDGQDGLQTMDVTSSTLDILSVADAMEPHSFELRSAQTQYRLALGALAVCSTTRTQDVGALAPPARFPTSSGPHGEKIGDETPLTTLEYLDRLASQGGLVLRHGSMKHTSSTFPVQSNPQ